MVPGQRAKLKASLFGARLTDRYAANSSSGLSRHPQGRAGRMPTRYSMSNLLPFPYSDVADLPAWKSGVLLRR
jgi:hypothetical protein